MPRSDRSAAGLRHALRNREPQAGAAFLARIGAVDLLELLEDPLLVLGRPVPLVRTRHISAPVPRNALSRWLYTSATTRIVTAGESLKRELVERNGFPLERIDSVPTGIDTQRFRPGDRGAAKRRPGSAVDTRQSVTGSESAASRRHG